MNSVTSNRAFALVLAVIALFTSSVAWAQQEGARGYMLGPEGTHAIIFQSAFAQANQSTETSAVVVGSDVTSYLNVLEYAQPFTVAGNSASLFFFQPGGKIKGSVSLGDVKLENTSSGVGDLGIGGMVGLIGMPALPLQSYLTYKPGFSLAAAGVAMAPTGEYDRDKLFNLGTNRWAFRAALPMSYNIGKSFADPELTTFEFKPTITFFTANEAPFGADEQTQDPFIELEGHITRNLNSAVWVSADIIYQVGSETTTDGVSDNNRRMNLNAGGTVAVNVAPSVQMRLSYAQSIAKNEFGFEGQGVRVMMVGSW